MSFNYFLISFQNRNHENPTVINARLSELAASRGTLSLVLITNIPQIVATIIVLALHWDDNVVCDAPHRTRWRTWAVLTAFRMAASTAVAIYMHTFKEWLDANPVQLSKANSFKNSADAFALIWFIVGNMWLFGDDDQSCTNPMQSPVYNLCLSMLVIVYVQICAPCILVLLMLPLLCCCMPCLIRMMARMQNRANLVRHSLLRRLNLSIFMLIVVCVVPTGRVRRRHRESADDHPVCGGPERLRGQHLPHLPERDGRRRRGAGPQVPAHLPQRGTFLCCLDNLFVLSQRV